MKSKFSFSALFATFMSVALVCAVPVSTLAQSQPAAQGPKAFDTPQQAADTLIKAAGEL